MEKLPQTENIVFVKATGADDTRLLQAAIEGIVLIGAYDPSNKKDEEHAWTGIAIDKKTVYCC